jgi:MraZ protein
VFRGTFPIVMDEKGRLKMPDDFARHLRKTEIFVTVSQDGQSLWALPPAKWAELEASMRGESILDLAAEDLREWFAGACHPLMMDAQDRLTLPAVLREEAGMSREIAVVGQLDYIAIWDRERWNARRRQIAERQGQARARVERVLLPTAPVAG